MRFTWVETRPAPQPETEPRTGLDEGDAAADRRWRGRHGIAHRAGSICASDPPAGQLTGVSLSAACYVRKSFEGLDALVWEHRDLDAFAGHLFVFARTLVLRIALTTREKTAGWLSTSKVVEACSLPAILVFWIRLDGADRITREPTL